jgi:hypothetical protein
VSLKLFKPKKAEGRKTCHAYWTEDRHAEDTGRHKKKRTPKQKRKRAKTETHRFILLRILIIASRGLTHQRHSKDVRENFSVLIFLNGFVQLVY